MFIKISPNLNPGVLTPNPEEFWLSPVGNPAIAKIWECGDTAKKNEVQKPETTLRCECEFVGLYFEEKIKAGGETMISQTVRRKQASQFTD